MSQTNAIILTLREDETQRFEKLFETEILPMWQQFKAQGKFLAASLTPVEGGSEVKEGVRDYILHVELPSMAEHHAFDSDPRFLSFLEKAKLLQPEKPKVWFGEPKFLILPA